MCHGALGREAPSDLPAATACLPPCHAIYASHAVRCRLAFHWGMMEQAPAPFPKHCSARGPDQPFMPCLCAWPVQHFQCPTQTLPCGAGRVTRRQSVCGCERVSLLQVSTATVHVCPVLLRPSPPPSMWTVSCTLAHTLWRSVLCPSPPSLCTLRLAAPASLRPAAGIR